MKRIMLVGVAGLAALLVGCGEGDDKAPISAIELAADGEFIVGTQVQLRVIATRSDDTRDRLVEGLVFTSSDDSIASVNPAGLVTVHVGGPVSFTATVDNFNDVLDARTTCIYPNFAPDIVYGRTMPRLSWPAKWPNGESFTLDLADVHCNKEWREKIDTLVVVISAEWCNPCKDYAKKLALAAEGLEADHRTQILYVIGQDKNGDTIGTEYAYNYMDFLIDGRVPGIVVGDLDTLPESGFVQTTSQLRAWPSSFIVRTRDMKVIASNNLAPESDPYLQIEKIADNPDGDWSKGNRGSFVNKCSSGDEESSEPNDLPGEAVQAAAGIYDGGICNDFPDLYQIEIDGTWELELEFDATVGDLDVLVWDANTNQPLVVDGQVIGSTGATGVEKFAHAGRAMVGVHGYNHASAPYTLTITEKK